MGIAVAGGMIQAFDPASLYGPAMPPTPGGPGPSTGATPGVLNVTGNDVLRGLNPLQHLPVVGMIYRAATGDQIPSPMRVAGAGILGGPFGMIGAAFMSLLEELIRLGPDTSRPAAPAGMAQTGSESGVQPVTPGSLSGTAYTTLATSTPDFLQSPTGTGQTQFAQGGAAAYQTTMSEFARSQALEKGLG